MFSDDVIKGLKLFPPVGEDASKVRAAITAAYDAYLDMREANAFYTPLLPGWSGAWNAPNPEPYAVHCRRSLAREVARGLLGGTGLCARLQLPDGPKRTVDYNAEVRKHARCAERREQYEFPH